MFFHDRADAGKKLASALSKTKGDIVLAIPRGGVICAVAVAKTLRLPLDLVLAKKIGHPHSPEYAIGAVGERGVVAFSGEAASVDQDWLGKEKERTIKNLQHWRRSYLTNRPSLSLKGKHIIIVDDGMATGLSVEVAVRFVKTHFPASITVAVPVAHLDTAKKVSGIVDELVALEISNDFAAVGQFYENFTQVSDEEVVQTLEDYYVFSR